MQEIIIMTIATFGILALAAGILWGAIDDENK
jgi:hypothetical protein